MAFRKDTHLVDGVLISTSPRYVDWRDILDGDEVPLGGGKPFMADLAGQKTEVFPLDIKRLRPVQRERLVDWIVKNIGTQRSEAYREIDRRGFPIRAEDVKVVEAPRAFL